MSFSTSQRIGASLAYAIPSLAVMFSNKALYSSQFDFKHPRFLILLQFSFSALILRLLSAFSFVQLKKITLKTGKVLNSTFFQPIHTFFEVKQTAFLSLAFIFNTLLGLIALGGENVPMFSALRHLGTLFILPMEMYYLRRFPSQEALFATFLIVFGTLIAAANDLTFDLHAYFIVGISNAATAIYLILIKKFSNTHGKESFSAFDLLYTNTVLSIPTLTILFVCSDEFEQVMHADVWFDETLAFQSILLLSLISAAGTELGMYLNTSINSPMTQNTVGVAKNSLASVFGMLLRDYKFDQMNAFGLLINASGAMYYSYLKMMGKELAQSENTIQFKVGD